MSPPSPSSSREPTPTGALREPGSWQERARRLLPHAAVALGVLYPLGLVIVTAVLARVGERWWVTSVVLYLPRAIFAAPLAIVVPLLVKLRFRRLLLLQVAPVLTVAFPLMGLVLPTPRARASTGATLRVLSYNVNSAGNDEPATLAEVLRFAPDVVLFQEAGGVADSLADRLRAHYRTARVTNQFVVASRYPILSERAPDGIPLEGRVRSPRYVAYTLDTPLGRIALYNVHPISPREGLVAVRGRGAPRELASGRLLRGTKATLLRSINALRELQIASVAEHAARESDPVVIAGDTNLTTLSPVLRTHFGTYEDGFSAAGWGFGYTFPTDRRVGAWMRLDRVLVGRALQVVGFQVGTSRVSDHRCVVADIQRAPN